MKYLIILTVFFTTSLLAVESDYSDNITVLTETKTGIDPSTPLVNFNFFGIMNLLLPEDIIRNGNISTENDFGQASLESKNKLVSITIRRKGAADLDMVKRIHESMAVSTYNGVIITSEFRTIENQNIYIFEQTGFWNDSKTEEFWVKFYTVYQGSLYQCLIRYPKDEMNETKQIREQIINSLSFSTTEK